MARRSSAGRSKPAAGARTLPAPAEAEPRAKRGRPRLGKPVARHLGRDEELLMIAAEVFYKLGFEGTRLDDIAAEAGIVKGSLYHYFDSKEHIYQRLVETIKGTFDEASEAPESLPPEKRLEIIARARATQVASNPVAIGIFSRQMIKMEGEVGRWSRDLARRTLATLRSLVVQGQRTGAFRAGDPDLLARHIMGSWIYLVDWYRPKEGESIQPVVDELVEFVLAGVRKA